MVRDLGVVEVETCNDDDLAEIKEDCREQANWFKPRSKFTADEVARLQRIALQTVPKLIDEIKRLRREMEDEIGHGT